ncbi:EF-hand domain-containing protein [Flavisphingomonas formosensis]|uniref:hypothetical protein n=1 Tax=Flavisphingomonas formosensis TaxID=861534 RepID=UPI001E4A13C8|nr:hypothetical protein [Sphingomonas formosensis]
MNRIAVVSLMVLALAQAGPGQAKKKSGPRCSPNAQQLFLSPMGEPFRAGPGVPYPVAAWFAKADTDHDGKLTVGEFVAESDAYFNTLDLNHDGEIDPAEISAYETKVPEVAQFRMGGGPGGGRWKEEQSKASDSDSEAPPEPAYPVFEGPMGAGSWSFLNIPQPVASADSDFNRGVSAREFHAAAIRRFGLIDTAHVGVLTLATLPHTPAQEEGIACAAKLQQQGGK